MAGARNIGRSAAVSATAIVSPSGTRTLARYGAILCFATVTAQPLVTGGTGHTWTNAIYDNFDTLGAPNLTTWNYWDVDTDRGAALGKASFWLRRENTFIATEAATGLPALLRRTTSADIGYGAQQSAGGLESNQQFGPGTFFQTTTRRGNPASVHDTDWTQTFNGMNGVPPDASIAAGGSEVDIRENIAGSQQNNVLQGGYSGGSQSPQGIVTDNNYHTYGLWWDVNSTFLKFYVDGTLVRTFTSNVPTNTDQVFRLTVECDFGFVGGYSETWTTNASVWTW